jgi:hypothetical protein
MLEIALAIVVISLPGLKPLIKRSSSGQKPFVGDDVVQVYHGGPQKEEKK